LVGTMFRLRICRYALVLLLMWGWVDDFCVTAATPDPTDDVLTSENDEFPPKRRLPEWQIASLDEGTLSLDFPPEPGDGPTFPDRTWLQVALVSPLPPENGRPTVNRYWGDCASLNRRREVPSRADFASPRRDTLMVCQP